MKKQKFWTVEELRQMAEEEHKLFLQAHDIFQQAKVNMATLFAGFEASQEMLREAMAGRLLPKN